jgi:sugar phosphate permease
MIPRWEFRHLRVWGGARMAGGVVLTACSVLTLSFGGKDAKTYRWAVAFLAAAALNFAGGLWELAIARSTPPGGRSIDPT